MQTFLPYANFHLSASCLDYKRLGKQRVECKQILLTLHTGRKSWANHPAVSMWRGYENALSAYYNACVQEWCRRGYKNTMPLHNLDGIITRYPPWFGNVLFHNSHKSNLLRKDATFYGQYGWNVPDNIPYVWPEVR